MKTATKDSIQAEINALLRVEHMIETNDGTYGASEACRKVGSGDPAFATRRVYETVGGSRRSTGPDEADAPGYMRKINAEDMKADRKRLADLRAALRSATK